MEFINTAALWGLGLVAVPIIIHLITRKKALRKPFAAIRFVLLSHQHLKQRLRLKRILILLARILAVVMLAMLIAHPTLPAGKSAMQIGDEPRSLVVVVDNSISMLADIDGSRPWDRALALAESVADSIGTGQEVALMATNPNGQTTAPPFMAKPADVRAAVEKLKPSFAYRPITESLIEAVSLLETAHHELRQILLITDLQRAPWLEDAGGVSAGTRMVVLDVGGAVDYPANAAVADIELEPSAGEASYAAIVEVDAFANEPMPGKEIVLLVGEKSRARGFLDLPAGGRSHKRLSFSADGRGILRGIAHLSPDALQVDNDRFFTARAGGRIRALVVDGDPKAERYGAESYYLMNALNPKLEARSRINPTLITATGLAKSKLDDFDMVMLANVRALEARVLDMLKQYVSEGGALLISLGDNTEARNFSALYGDLAPADLYILKELSAPTHLDPTGTDHPAASLFALPEGGDISLAGFSKYFMLDLSTQESVETKTVLKFQDGSPALVEKPYGRGRTALWTSTLDRDWNDLCIYPTYLPVLQQLGLYLTGGMSDPVRSGYKVGEVARFTCPADAETAWIFGPDGVPGQYPLSKENDSKEGALLLDSGPGIYEAFCTKGEKLGRRPNRDPDRVVTANVDVRESDLHRWDSKALENHLKSKGFKHARVVKDIGEISEEEGFKPGRRDAFRLMLGALLTMLLLEGFLTRKG